LLKKNDKKDLLIMRWVDMWRQKKQKKYLYAFWKKYAKRKGDIKRNSEFCDTFFDQGLKMRAMRGIKLYCQVAGNRLYEHRVKERIKIEVLAKVEEKKN
jgi:phage/plasmid-associated DNA primase